MAHGLEIASFEPADAFTPLPDESTLDGQAFRIATVLRESDDPRLTRIIGGWSYDRQTQILRVGISTAAWQRTQLPEAEADTFMHYGLRVGTRNLSNESTAAQNAFGAQFDVQSIEAQAVQVAPLTRRERSASVDVSSDMFVDLPLAPEDARSAVAGAEVVVEGVLVGFDGNRITLCYDSGSNAAIDRRLATLIHTCVMNSRITRVAIISGTGAALFEWLPGQQN